ncbi:MAG: hypothetical protein FP831_19220 [Anaerolineae bacterium]|nr:hypothetical protein [Anaerolineae bacterium]
MSNIYSTAQVAEKLGITDGLVLKRALKMGLDKIITTGVGISSGRRNSIGIVKQSRWATRAKDISLDNSLLSIYEQLAART